ncbi:MAG TPA: FG-GAP repeat protein [Thermoanaerobaculia bacterium]|nr:FG-GAP repeat protein [Thermoanaerobaculia bacterium]
MEIPARVRLAVLVSCLLAATTPSAWGARTEQAKLLPLERIANDWFGASVAISGQTALVGARDENEAQGAAYVFIRSGSGWYQQARLAAPDGSYEFGGSVAVSGDTAVVAAYYGNPDVPYSGAVHVFVRNGSSWSEQGTLLAPDAESYDGFGASIAISGDTIAVGAPYSDSTPSRRRTGATYVFVRQGTSWSMLVKLLASDGQTNDELGRSVALSGDTLVAGAPYRVPAGAVYTFQRSGSSWVEQARIPNPDGGFERAFGESVALSGGTLAVGAPPPLNHLALDVGVAYVFGGGGGSWSRQATLFASNGEPGDLFGWSIALSENTVVVGAMYRDGSTGAAYAFMRSGIQWSDQGELLASDREPWDLFGIAVAVSGGTVMVGAPGVNDPETVEGVGAVYLFSASGVLVSPSSGLITFENGSTASLSVVLNTEPAGNVVIDLVSSDPSEGTVSPARLTFTADDWSIPQTVTLTGLNDFVDDNGQAYTVTLTMNQELTEDSIYDGIDPEDVAAANLEFDGDFYIVLPCRVLDTRLPEQGPHLDSGVDRMIALHDTCGVPSTARAVAVNVTVVWPTGDGALTLYPNDLPSPSLDTLTFAAGRNQSINAIVLLAIDGTGTLKVKPLVANNGYIHLVIDLAGYFE